MLSLEKFKSIIENAPLVSIDFIIRNAKNKILLGKRKNKPAQGFYFTIGGRIYKNEKIIDAQKRIIKEEININLANLDLTFIGVFEHFYEDGFCDDISTHYVNFAYEINISCIQNLPIEQHDNYIWLEESELLNSNEVHNYVKDYFNRRNR